MVAKVSTLELSRMMQDARQRTLELIDGLNADQLMGPKIDTVNPLRWEIGHIAYWYEYFISRMLHSDDSLLGAKADLLYDSIAVHHHTRWDLPLLSLNDTLAYMQAVQDRLIERLGEISQEKFVSKQERFVYQFGIFHEDMHTEAFLWGRQTLAFPTPVLAIAADVSSERAAGPLQGFVEIPGGTFMMGGSRNAEFLFDNEKYSFEIAIPDFVIARAPVTNGEFLQFVEADGYGQDQH